MSELIDQLRKEHLLYPFSTDTDFNSLSVVDALYEAFSDYGVCMPTCDVCCNNPDAFYKHLLNLGPTRNVNPGEISQLYYEPPLCIGVESWMRYFPRMLHAGFFDDSEIPLLDRALGVGLWAWPDAQQDITRQFLSLAFFQWVLHEHTELFDSTITEPMRHDARLVTASYMGRILFESLLICRIDIASILDWLLQVDNRQSKLLLCGLVDRSFSFWGWGLDGSKDDGGVSRYSDACLSVLSDKVSEDVLIGWMLGAESDYELQREIEAAAKRSNHWERLIVMDRPYNEGDFQLFLESYANSAQRYSDVEQITQE